MAKIAFYGIKEKAVYTFNWGIYLTPVYKSYLSDYKSFLSS